MNSVRSFLGKRVLFGLIVTISLPDIQLNAQSRPQPQRPTTTTPAAKSNDKPNTEAAEALALRRSKAAAILSGVSDELVSLEARGGEKIILKAKLADAMWAYDEPRGQQMMRAAASDFKAYLEALYRALRESKPAPPESSFYNAGNLSQFIGVVARRDPALAKDISNDARSMADVAVKDTLGTARDSGARALAETMSAYGLLDTDTRMAVEMGEAAVANEVDVNFFAFLTKLSEKDPAEARRLFAKALETAMRTRNWRVIPSLAMYALPGFGVSAIRYNSGLMGAPGDTESGNLLLKRVCDAASEQNRGAAPANPREDPTGQRTAIVLLSLLPHFERLMPQCANQVQMSVNTLTASTPPGSRETMINGTTQKTAEQYLSDASNAQDKNRQDQYYSRAMLEAVGKGEWEQAFRIVDMFNDEKARDANKSLVAYRAALSALAKKDIDRALRYAPLVRDVEEIAQIYSRAASLMIEIKDKKRAAELIRSGRDLVEKGADQAGAGDALMLLGGTMSRLDAVTAFEIAASGIDILNRRMKDPKRQPLRREIGVSQFAYSTRLELTMLSLAECDFEESLRVAKLVEDKTSSILCRIAICRAMMSMKKG